VCVYVYECVCVYVYVYVCVRVCVYVRTCMSVCVHESVDTHMEYDDGIMYLDEYISIISIMWL